MHTIAVQLAPVLGAEKSKVPFYVAGGLLVVWALFVSLGIGVRRPDFPASLSEQRAVLAVTAVLVLAAVTTAVLTSGGATSSQAAATPAQTQSSAGSGGAEAPAAGQTTAASPSTATATAPRATTGTPAPASSPAARTSALKLAADPGGALSYNTKQLSAKAGSVSITLTNAAPLGHNLTIAQGSKVLGATPTFTGGAKSLKLTLKPGTYTFYCSVPGHRQAGMEGTLTVS
ncbi:MAG TPA: plastocyanin/azurin family copper-binding protein [Solirubrobacteraceae bacterium]|jgi:plastocyanin